LPKIGRDGGPAMERNEATNTSLRMIATAMSATAMHIKINVLLSIVIGVCYAAVKWVTPTITVLFGEVFSRLTIVCQVHLVYDVIIKVQYCGLQEPPMARWIAGCGHTTWCVGNAVVASVDGTETGRLLQF